MSRLDLTLFGGFQAALDGEPLRGFESNKARALLIYLGVEEAHPHARIELATLLWPQMVDAAALRNLRHALANLRRVLGDARAHPPFLLIDRHTVRLNPAANITVDVGRFRHYLEEAQAARVSDQTMTTLLQSAVTLVQGEFLQGFHLRGSAPWEEWVLLRREEFAQGHRMALRLLSQLYERRQDYEQAIVYARRWVQQAPWHEEAHCQLIRLLALNGQRSAALKQYELCRLQLQRELSVEPAPDTTALANAIREGAFPQPHAHPAPPAARPAHARPIFVAREQEMARLTRFWERALTGQAQFAFITGEAGSGKSALAAAFGRRLLQRRQGVVVRGACNAFAGRGDPLLPFRDIFLALLGEANALRLGDAMGAEYSRSLQSLLPITASILIAYGPDLIQALGLQKTLRRQIEAFLPPGQRKQALLQQLRSLAPDLAPPRSDVQRFAQYTETLAQIAQRSPLALILDDLQWADASTLALLFHLAHRLTNQPIFILGAFRKEAVLDSAPGMSDHPLARLVRECQRRRGPVLIDLDQSSGRAFIAAYLDSEPNDLDDAFREQLYAHTGGHALFTVELLSSLQEKGYLTKEAGRWRRQDNLSWDTIPPRIDAIIAERLAHLSPESRELLTAASVAVDDFSAEALAAMLNWPDARVRALLETLAAPPMRLLVFRGRSWSGARALMIFRFRHILFKMFLYRQMTEAARQRWHERMGLALESLSDAQTPSSSSTLAHHFDQARRPLKAARYYLQAGNQAMMRFAPEEALALYSRGLALIQQAPASQAAKDLEVALQLAMSTPWMVMQGWGAKERIQASQRAYELCQQTGDEQTLMQAMFIQGDMLRARGRYEESAALGRQLQAIAQEREDARGMALAHWTLGATRFFQGRLESAREHLASALAWAADLDANRTFVTSTDLLVVCHVWLAWTEELSGRPHEANAHVEAAMARAQALEQRFSRGFALFLGVYGVSWLRNDVQALQAYRKEAAQCLDDEELAAIHPWGYVFQGWAMAASGNLEEGIALMARGMAQWRKMGAVSGLTCQGLPLARAYVKANRKAEARALVQEMMALMEQTGERLFESAWRELANELHGAGR